MKLEDFHCDSVGLTFSFSIEDFDKKSFYEAIGVDDESEYVDEDGDLILNLSLPSSKDPKSLHAHLTIVMRKDETPGRCMIDIHAAGPKEVKKEAPYLEESTQWLSRFFTKEITTARMSAWYLFDNKFEPLIPIPFPLVVSSKKLAGLKVNGLSLLFPRETQMEDAIIQRNKPTEIYVFLGTRPVISLKDFDLQKQLEKQNEIIVNLVKEKTNDSISQNTDT